MRRRLFTMISMVTLLLAAPPVYAASLDGLSVDVKNESEAVLCAEKDNVAVSFANKDVRSFRIEAAHPVYLGSGLRDNFEADWTACDMSADTSYAAPGQPRKVTLYEETEMWVVGYAFPAFWRPSTATVRIGDRVEKGLHLLQVWLLRTDGAEEVLVLYPQDGYWRPRPMTPPNMRNTGYGSSFLVGPIETDGRPLVKFKEVAFDPKSRMFTLTFEKGGSATVRIAKADTNRLALDVAFDRAIDNGPFAMLRSMYVTEFNNDVARIAVREKAAKGWREENIMTFGKAHATDVWMGRLSPSQHNTSSPDVVFNSFSDGPLPKRPKSEPPPAIEPKKAE
ncbi:MAG: hypothetical protein ABL907_08410 [Hyphomicrobium sp.]